MSKIFKPNTHGFQVLTPAGFQPFAGVSTMGTRPVLKMDFNNGRSIECSYDHKFYITDDIFCQAQDLNVGDTVITTHGHTVLVKKTDSSSSELVYDLIQVENGHRYFTNDLLSSNCEFLIYDETLVNSIKLSELQGINPVFTTGQVRWYKQPSSAFTYTVALDPSMGTGSNHSAIQVLELPSYEQVAEWQDNSIAIPGQIRVLADICKYILEKTRNMQGIYWSIENNGIGEAALLVVADYGEENIPGLFLSEPIRKGHVRKYRKGFNTTHMTKITACSRMKTMIETNKFKVNSKPLIYELKNFISSGSSFRAKAGASDDLISAILLTLRMIDVLKDWDPRIYNSFSQVDVIDQYDFPMPIFISKNY